MSDPVLKISKIWRSDKGVYFFRTRLAGSSQDKEKYPDAFYLILDSNQRSWGIRVGHEKPDNLAANEPFVELFRKHLGEPILFRLLQKETTGHIWLCFSISKERSVEADWYIQLTKDKPPQVSLISRDKIVLIRTSSLGTFTKRKSFEGEFPCLENEFEFINLLPQLLGRLITSNIAKPLLNNPSSLAAVDRTSDLQKVIRQKLNRKLKTLKKALDKMEKSLPDPQEIEQKQTKAELLKNFLYLVKKGQERLILNKEITGLKDDFILEVDPLLTPGDNLEKYFKSLKGLRRGLNIGEKRKKTLVSDISTLNSDLERLRNEVLNTTELNLIEARHGLLLDKKSISKEPSTPVAKPYWTFMGKGGKVGEGGENETEIYVGKNSEQNDLLTKMAKSNDFWFHAVCGTGAHVLIPFQMIKKDSLPPKLLKQAAILALYHSTLKKDFSGEVYFTRRRHLKKKKNSPPGLWQIDKAETIFIRYTEEELSQILGQRKY